MSSNHWQALCSRKAIIARNKLYSDIRDFFNKKSVLEVETPILSTASVTDPYIDSLEVFSPKDNSKKYFLQTSPEFAMKRMLCDNFGDIFQICKSFRAEEIGRKHNIEFTMLEWYRLNFNMDDLINEVCELIIYCLRDINEPRLSATFRGLTAESGESQRGESIIKKISYKDLFIEYLAFDPNLVDIDYLKKLILNKFETKYSDIINSNDFDKNYNKDDLLMILISDYIEPELDHEKITVIYDYPRSQSALAKIDNSIDYPVAKRFEVYYKGMELANGFHELSDYTEQKNRFLQDINKRKKQHLPDVSIDYKFLSALESGLPDCSGVALGLDRLLMIKQGVTSIEDVLVFRN